MEKMKTLPSSWQASLSQWLSLLNNSSRLAILGIGNTLRSDDAAGILAVRALLEAWIARDHEHILVLDAGFAPENSTAILRPFAPELILLIDAAEMNEPPGSVGLIDMDELDGMSASTHSLPLSMLANYLTLELNCDVRLLGIQPAFNTVGERVSPQVRQAIDNIVEALTSLLSAPSEEKAPICMCETF